MKGIEDLIKVMEAYNRGEQIESRRRFPFNGEWNINDTPLWNWIDYEYRVKPKERLVPLETEPLDLFGKLPRLDAALNVIQEDEYNPTLYFFEDEWNVTWCNMYEGDTILNFSGDTIEIAIENAYRWCVKNHKL